MLVVVVGCFKKEGEREEEEEEEEKREREIYRNSKIEKIEFGMLGVL